MYKIGSFVFDIIHPGFIIPENFKLFYDENAKGTYVYEMKIVDEVCIEENDFILNKQNIKVVDKNGLEKRYILVKGDIKPYACIDEIDTDHSVVTICKDYLDMMIYDTMFVSLLSLERHLYPFHEYILHSCYIVYNNEAILFTAPSETGKSTQGNLWKDYKGARVVNGDRSLIVKKDGKYYASGWPVCGSSGICFNESYPIKAIVYLHQDKVNHVIKMKYKECILKLLREVTVNYHNNEYMDDVLKTLDDYYSSIPIYSMGCDISQDAVETLYKAIV